MEALVEVLGVVIERIDMMVTEKDEVLEVIESIAAFSEEEAAYTEQITSNVNVQARQAKQLLDEAIGLEESVRELEMSMNHFVVEKNR